MWQWLRWLFGLDSSTNVILPELPPLRSGRKRALLVGINKYQIPNADLNGCVNDVTRMRDLLVDVYGFDPDNIRLLTDERATREGILERLYWLFEGSQAGDEIVFHYSGHGAQVRDRDGDELDDGLDEILCPTDMDWDYPLTDDDLAVAFKGLAKGAYFTMISDSCHSGTITRELTQGLVEQYAKRLNPPADIWHRNGNKDLPVNVLGAREGDERGQRHVLLSGCRDNQTSADACFNGVWNGALTYMLLNVLEESPNMVWDDVVMNVRKRLVDAGFDQVPQLRGEHNLCSRAVFGGNVGRR